MEGLQPGDWINIVIAFITALAAAAAFFTAYLNWRTRPQLLATKEKHSKDLMNILDSWSGQISSCETNDDIPTLEDNKYSSPCINPKSVLFDDLINHIPDELDLFSTSEQFNQIFANYENQRRSLYSTISNFILSKSHEKLISDHEYGEKNNGILRYCIDWLYQQILQKVRGQNIPKVGFIIEPSSPNDLRVSDSVWARVDNPKQFQNFLEFVIDNINNNREDVAEYNLIKEAKKLCDIQVIFYKTKQTLLQKVAEAEAIPIFSGDCKHIKRATEPLFPRVSKKYAASFRRFYEDASLSITFLAFSVVLVSVINFDAIFTWPSILFLILGLISFFVFLIFSAGLIQPKITEWYQTVFERPKAWIATIFIPLFWIAIVISFFSALFSESIRLPPSFRTPTITLAFVWAVFLIIALVFRFISVKRNKTDHSHPVASSKI